MLTEEQFKAALPAIMKKRITPEVMTTVNSAFTDPHMREELADNILGYAHVLRDGRFKMDAYVNAVKYCSYKMMGDTNKSAYCKTFPVKYQKFLLSGVAEKDIASYITAYNKSKLVVSILGHALVPLHILNMDKEQEAVNVLADLMHNARSEKVKSDSANNLLHHLRRPEAQKIELEVSHKSDSAVNELRDILGDLAAKQLQMIGSGTATAKDIAHMPILIEQKEADDGAE